MTDLSTRNSTTQTHRDHDWMTPREVAVELRCGMTRLRVLMGLADAPCLIHWFYHGRREFFLREKVEEYKAHVAGSNSPRSGSHSGPSRRSPQ